MVRYVLDPNNELRKVKTVSHARRLLRSWGIVSPEAQDQRILLTASEGNQARPTTTKRMTKKTTTKRVTKPTTKKTTTKATVKSTTKKTTVKKTTTKKTTTKKRTSRGGRGRNRQHPPTRPHIRRVVLVQLSANFTYLPNYPPFQELDSRMLFTINEDITKYFRQYRVESIGKRFLKKFQHRLRQIAQDKFMGSRIFVGKRGNRKQQYRSRIWDVWYRLSIDGEPWTYRHGQLIQGWGIDAPPTFNDEDDI